MFQIFPALAACLVVAGCAAPSPPTINSRDVSNAFAEAAFISRLPQTRIENLPTGVAQYKGKLGADVSGDLRGSILGDMAMQVDFNRNHVTGTVSEINLIDSAGRPEQELSGSLAISGFENNGFVGARAQGRVSGVQPNGPAFATNMDLNLTGTIRDDRGRGDAIFGTAIGQARGDVNLGVDGVFYGTR